MQFLITVSIAMLAGLLMTRFTKLFNLPAVTAYLLAGLVVGPFVLGAIDLSALGLPIDHFGFSAADFGIDGGEANVAFEILSNVSLGFIAFAIGNEFRMSELKHIGKQATVIGILQALAAAVLVDGALIALHFAMPDVLTIPVAIILGAIATATAPAATLMVVRQYKAKGKLTDLLLPIVALDDAVGLVVFSISFGVAKALGSAGGVSIVSVLVNPLLEVVLSLLLGFVMGYLFTVCERFFHSGSKRMALSITFVLLTVALSMLKFHIGEVHIGFSSLLVCMMLGTVFCNMCDFSADIMERADKWTAPIFVLFFVLSGAELRLDILANVWVILIGVVYILSRAAGKYFGTMGSAKLTGCDDKIQKYLGITLLPQAGVALGMSAIVAQDTNFTSADSTLVRNIVLFSVLVLELVGPVLTKWALTRAGDIKEKTTEGFNREKFLAEQAQKEAAEQAAAEQVAEPAGKN